MLRRRVLLVEEVPQITPVAGLFHVDFGVNGVPKLAISPHTLLGAIELAKRAYLDFAAANEGVVRPVCTGCERAGH